MSARRAARRLSESGLVAAVILALFPAAASAHLLTGRYESALPLAAYLGGAAVAVGLSFAIVIVRTGRAAPATPPAASPARPIAVPRLLRLGTSALGLVAWLWIVVQGLVGGVSSDADVGSLFLWTYGWVGLPLLAAFVGPVWEWFDPFATLHDLGAAAVRRLGIARWRPAAYPAALGRWPAVVAMGVFIWLELVYASARGGRVLTLAVLLYTAWALLMMVQYGRDTWRRNGEAFTVWLGILNRFAPLAPLDDDATILRRRPPGAGLLEATWLTSELVFVAVGTASILFDGLSQTQPWFDLFGTPSLAAATILLIAFLAAIAALVLIVARIVGTRAMAAGLVPIALGYLIAHYFTALAFDGQRIVTVVSDPFNVGWNVFGGASFEPNETYLPFGIVWAIELVAVVGGHICGAVMGHRAVVEPTTVTPAGATGGTTKARRTRSRPTAAGTARPTTTGMFAGVRSRQVPIAVLMVFLTTLTLWSLGQNLVHTANEATAGLAASTRS